MTHCFKEPIVSMTERRIFFGRNATIACAFSLAILSCVMGLLLCFIKSPQARSVDYLEISREAFLSDPALSYSAAMEAVRLDPSSAPAWDILAQSLQQKGEHSTVLKVRSIVARLQNNPGDIVPVYAMPAELRLSFLTPSSEGL